MTSLTGSRTRRRLRYGLYFLAFLTVVVAMRAPLLRALAIPLVYADKSTTATSMLLLAGDSRLDEAKQFHQANSAGKILILERPPGRLVRLQIVAPPQDLERRALIKRGISDDRIEVVSCSNPESSVSDALLPWLTHHPDETIIVLCESFESRAVRWEFDRKLPSHLSSRVAVRPMASRSYDGSSWWHGKRGIMGLVRGWIGLMLPVIQDGDKWKWRECNPEIFEPGTT